MRGRDRVDNQNNVPKVVMSKTRWNSFKVRGEEFRDVRGKFFGGFYLNTQLWAPETHYEGLELEADAIVTFKDLSDCHVDSTENRGIRMMCRQRRSA